MAGWPHSAETKADGLRSMQNIRLELITLEHDKIISLCEKKRLLLHSRDKRESVLKRTMYFFLH